MADIALALQKALMGVLAGMTAPTEATGVGTVLVDLFDAPADNAPFPFVGLGRHEITNEDTQDERLDRHEIELEIWSKYKGARQIQIIAGQIVDRLHNQAPALEQGQCISCRVTSRVSEREQDGNTYKGTVTITALTSPEDL